MTGCHSSPVQAETTPTSVSCEATEEIPVVIPSKELIEDPATVAVDAEDPTVRTEGVEPVSQGENEDPIERTDDEVPVAQEVNEDPGTGVAEEPTVQGEQSQEAEEEIDPILEGSQRVLRWRAWKLSYYPDQLANHAGMDIEEQFALEWMHTFYRNCSSPA